MVGMFNENRTFLKNICHREPAKRRGGQAQRVFLPRRHEENQIMTKKIAGKTAIFAQN
jgi:hypothetical protein